MIQNLSAYIENKVLNTMNNNLATYGAPYISENESEEVRYETALLADISEDLLNDQHIFNNNSAMIVKQAMNNLIDFRSILTRKKFYQLLLSCGSEEEIYLKINKILERRMLYKYNDTQSIYTSFVTALRNYLQQKTLQDIIQDTITYDDKPELLKDLSIIEMKVITEVMDSIKDFLLLSNTVAITASQEVNDSIGVTFKYVHPGEQKLGQETTLLHISYSTTTGTAIFTKYENNQPISQTAKPMGDQTGILNEILAYVNLQNVIIPIDLIENEFVTSLLTQAGVLNSTNTINVNQIIDEEGDAQSPYNKLLETLILRQTIRNLSPRMPIASIVL